MSASNKQPFPATSKQAVTDTYHDITVVDQYREYADNPANSRRMSARLQAATHSGQPCCCVQM